MVLGVETATKLRGGWRIGKEGGRRALLRGEARRLSLGLTRPGGAEGRNFSPFPNQAPGLKFGQELIFWGLGEQKISPFAVEAQSLGPPPGDVILELQPPLSIEVSQFESDEEKAHPSATLRSKNLVKTLT